MPIRAVLFDATGTLIELREPVGESYARFAERHGVSLPARRIRDGFGEVVAQRGPRVFAGASRDDVPELERSWWQEIVRDTFRVADPTVAFEDFESFFDELFHWYASAEAWQLRERAGETLHRLRRQGFPLGIVSDFDYRLTEVLESLGITALFETIVLAGAHGVAKPDPRLFAAALEALGLSASEVAYVGDDPRRDLEGARAAGLSAIDVRSLSSLAELPDRLATLSPSSGAPPSSPQDTATPSQD